MGRLDARCCGDCGSCELLRNGEVSMIPCAIDQLMQRVQQLSKKIDSLSKTNQNDVKIAFAKSDVEYNK